MKRKINIMIDVVFIFLIIIIICIGKASSTEKRKTTNENSFIRMNLEEEISALCVSGDEVYVGKNTGIDVYNANTLTLVRRIEDISLVYSASIIEDSDHNIWIGHEKGLTLIDSNNNRIEFSAPELPEGRVNSVAQIDHSIWCGTFNGAAVIENKNGQWRVAQILDKESGLLCDSVNVILQSQGNIFIGSYLDHNGGVTIIDSKGKMSYITRENALPHPYVTSMAELNNGDILVGTGYMREGGLAYIKRNHNQYYLDTVYDKSDNIPGEKIRYCYVDDSRLWITTEYDGVLIYSGNLENGINEEYCRIIKEEDGLTDNEIKCIVKTDNYYWLGGRYGLTLIPKDEIREEQNDGKR